MVATSKGALALLSCLALIVSLYGCTDENANEPQPGLAKGGAGPRPGGGPAVASNPQLKAVMEKVGKGPQSLQSSLGAALKQGEPAWDTIQPKTKEYAALTADLPKYDPPRGDKESWKKLSQAFAESAAELDKASQAREKDTTVAALDALGSSCMACHRQHRGGPGGPGGMGGPPGGMGGPRGGFGPPGGPGGSPPQPPGGPPPQPAGGPAPR
jgi:hypothetical protein